MFSFLKGFRKSSPASRMSNPRRFRPAVQQLESRELLSTTAVFNDAAGVQTVLNLHNDGTLWEDVGANPGYVASGVQAVAPLVGAQVAVQKYGNLYTWDGGRDPFAYQGSGIQSLVQLNNNTTAYLTGGVMYSWSGVGGATYQGSGIQSLVQLNNNTTAYLTGGVMYSWSGVGGATYQGSGIQSLVQLNNNTTAYLTGGALYTWNGQGASSYQRGGVNTLAQDGQGNCYILANDHTVYRANGTTLSQVGQKYVRASDLSFWYLGTAVVDSAGDYGIYCLSSSQVTQTGGWAVSLLSAEGTIWALNGANQVYRWTATGFSQQTTTTAADGSIWFLGTTAYANGQYAIYCVSGGQITHIPGLATQLALNGGFVHAVNSAGVTTVLGFGRPTADPSAPYSVAAGQLFPTNQIPVYQDVRQGAEGDCWLMASLAEVTARSPSDITNMFTFDGTVVENGTSVALYTVRFYNAGGTPQYVMVDTELPAGGYFYDTPIRGVLWAALAEKAYATANGDPLFNISSQLFSYSYAGLNGGWPSWALNAITGKHATETWDLSDLGSAWANGQLIVLDSNNSGTLNGVNIVSPHAYTVVGYNASTQQYTLFNPWGTWAPMVTGTAQELSGYFGATSIGTGMASTESPIILKPWLYMVEQSAYVPAPANQDNVTTMTPSIVLLHFSESPTRAKDANHAHPEAAGRPTKTNLGHRALATRFFDEGSPEFAAPIEELFATDRHTPSA